MKEKFPNQESDGTERFSDAETAVDKESEVVELSDEEIPDFEDMDDRNDF